MQALHRFKYTTNSGILMAFFRKKQEKMNECPPRPVACGRKRQANRSVFAFPKENKRVVTTCPKKGFLCVGYIRSPCPLFCSEVEGVNAG